MTDTFEPTLFPPGRSPASQCAPRRATLTLPDGYEAVVYVHEGRAPNALGPVLYLHGIQSHPAWFAGSAAALAARGHTVYQVTRRGSGENRRDRGHAASAGQLLDDVDAACRFVREQSGAERVHLIGVSWGGKLLATYAAGDASREGIASLTLVAPGIVPRVDVSTSTKAAIAVSAIFAPRREFDIPLGDAELFTDNPPMQDYIRRDELSLRRATARLLFASGVLDHSIRSAPRGAVHVPTTLILSSRDRIIDSGATAEVVRRLTGGRCKVLELTGAHTLEFEADPSPLYRALAGATEP